VLLVVWLALDILIDEAEQLAVVSLEAAAESNAFHPIKRFARRALKCIYQGLDSRWTLNGESYSCDGCRIVFGRFVCAVIQEERGNHERK
jgi:hypothetical protein